jgi:nucleoside-diphosphate-sugar epimerase
MSDSASFQLVSILPGTILGAHLGKKMAQSHMFFRNISVRNGKSGKNRGIPNVSLAISDVRDVARFHIAAMERETSEPTERFLCANIAVPMERILQIIHENFDDIAVPTRRVSDFLVRVALRSQPTDMAIFLSSKLSKPPFFSRLRLKTLGVPMRTPAESVVDTCR